MLKLKSDALLTISLFYFHSAEGKRFRSRNELRLFFLKHELPLNLEDFDFSVEGKDHKVKSVIENEKELVVSKEIKKAQKRVAPAKDGDESTSKKKIKKQPKPTSVKDSVDETLDLIIDRILNEEDKSENSDNEEVKENPDVKGNLDI